MTSEENMKSRLFDSTHRDYLRPRVVAHVQSARNRYASADETGGAGRDHGAEGFDTPQQAADAVIKAAGDLRRAGTDGDLRTRRQRLHRLGDPVQDKNNAAWPLRKRPRPRNR